VVDGQCPLPATSPVFVSTGVPGGRPCDLQEKIEIKDAVPAMSGYVNTIRLKTGKSSIVKYRIKLVFLNLV
jgi:hypothetical protein